METRTAEIIVSDCNRVKESIRTASENNTRLLSNELQKNIKILEFFLNELTKGKENLIFDVTLIASTTNRVEQTVKSFQYPKEVCLKCLEIR